MKKPLLVGLVISFTLAGGLVNAEEPEKMAEQPMPPTGAPEEMQHLKFLVGEWKVAGKYRMDMTKDEWTDSEATCRYAYILDGCALQITYNSEMMGMPYTGMGVQTYDRETKKWQVTWLDNMSARMSLYTGDRNDRTTVFTGEDMYGGEKFLSRMTTWDETDNSFKWKMEHSMDGGKNWLIGMEATYTKL